MSNTSALGDSGKISGQKMSFSQNCNLLSQYVKEKRNLSITPNNRGVAEGYNNNSSSQNRATMNLFPVKAATGVAEDPNACIGRTINLFPQLSGFSPLMANASGSNKRVSSEPPAAQMTIFYGGQVLVFNDLSVNKAKEVMDLASSYEPSQKKRKVETATSVPILKPNTTTSLNPNPNPTQNVNGAANFGKNVPATVPRSGMAATASDLPQARKASLHRFLEKRKDRLVGKAPQGADVNGGVPSKPVDGKSWLGLGSLPLFQPQQLQL